MAYRLVKTPRLIPVAGVPPTPARPAYCETKRELSGYKRASPAWDNAEKHNCEYTPVLVERFTIQGETIFQRWETVEHNCEFRYAVYRTYEQCYPAVPYSPGRPATVLAINDGSLNDGAHSINRLDQGMAFEVDLPRHPDQIIVGVIQRKASYYLPGSIQSGVTITPGGVQGFQGHLTGDLLPVPAESLRIERRGNELIYMAQGIEVARHEHNHQQAYAVALLAGLTDYVDNPRFVPIMAETDGIAEMLLQSELSVSDKEDVAGGLSIFRMSAYGQYAQHGISSMLLQSEGMGIANSGYGELEMQSDAIGVVVSDSGGIVIGEGGVSAAHGFAAFAGWAVSSDKEQPVITPEQGIGVAQGVWPRYSLDAESRQARPRSTTAIGMASLVSGTRAYSISGQIANAQSPANRQSGFASDHPTGKATIKYRYRPLINAWMTDRRMSAPVADSYIEALDAFDLETISMLSFVETVGVSSTIDVVIIVSASFYESLIAQDDISFSSILELMIQEKIRVNHQASTTQADAVQYAVNATTGAVSRYLNFGFSQFVRIGSKLYAIKDGDLYVLEGETDDGELLDALLDLGASDLGSAALKRISSAYAGITTDGDAYIKLAGDQGEPVTYRVVEKGAEGRAMTAKGLTARHWRMQLEIAGASFADLDNVEVEIGVSRRRLRGRR